MSLLSAFSLDAWKQIRGILTSGLSENFQAELFQELGLSHFVYEDSQKCSGSKPPYKGAVDNWNNGEHIYLYNSLYVYNINKTAFKGIHLREREREGEGVLLIHSVLTD